VPAAAVQREHPQRVQVLAQRLLRDERVELPGQLRVAAGGQVLLDRLLDRRQSQLLQSVDLERREWLAGDVVERRPAPESERLARRSSRDQVLEAADVDPAVAEAQLVAAPARDDLRAVTALRECLAQLRDVALDHLARARGRRIGPEAVDQLIGRDRRALVESEHRQHCPRLARADGDGAVVDAGLHGSQNSKVHGQRSLSETDPTPERRGRLRAALPRSTGPVPALYRGPRRCLSSRSSPPLRRGFR